ncbi:tol-pal system protein YbgF [Methylomonas methanica]|uniref:Cell division coordinator CpoB n=1 Tax=Methylomonas methanica (strain DSM 25384 / MC09) TaxID=857087 RepID=F9ZZV0_METMM|nr:tol-pal system protein YbgF [Methylomonas methanica]AEF99918.1 tol-pal system protein YbgF [Methylomonas methanica MC09]
MKKTALLMLCAHFGLMTEAGALPVNNSGYQGNAGYGAPAAGADSAIFEVLGRLEQLQLEVQQLRGIVEEQSQTIADLERKQSNMYSDLDDRIQLLSSPAQPAGAQSATTDTAQAAVPASAATATATEQPAAAAATVAPTPAAPETPVAEVKAAETPAVPVVAKASEKERYQEAYETLRNGHNAKAIQMFEALQSDFPAGEFSDNAQYWLGEAYKINREYDKARAAFNKVVSQYPKSSKVPDALLKLGYIEFDQQNMAKARDYLTGITTSYPETTAAHLASKKLAQMPQ